MRKQLQFLCTTILIILAATTACQPQENELSFETIDQDNISLWGQYEGREPNLMVLTDPENIAALNKMAPQPGEVVLEDTGESWQYPEWRLQDLDWQAHFVVIAFHGLRHSGGYKVTIKRIMQQGQRITVQAQFDKPGPEESKADIVTSPLHVVQVEKNNQTVGQEFQFSLVVDGTAVAYQNYFIP